ncbi:hypothetical protein F4813DRAFT_392759 [Daldinia decipiens]|uniref:uncharacterized protein n=1 Tax=Daldinia decipiens TaxID=326647 RepID=UPI0020C27FD7|nr:uncharacterized protein F4813DRAFT_392759 [Daldinia decipiens]KAI1654255.1 hypothetical protein F4813DRAFT_392759 [Daldinia decipiens]
MATYSNSPILIALAWGLGSLVIVFCAARLWIRKVIIDRASWDDIFMTLAAIFAIICSAFVTTAVHYGLGRHIENITDPYSRQMAIKYTILAPSFSLVSATLSKISILIFLTRLIGVAATRLHLACLWTLGGILVIANFIAIVVLLRFCIPIEKQWNPGVKGSCISPVLHSYSGIIPSAYTAFMDIVLAVFPSIIITQLNISRKMKISLCCLMGGSIFATGATIAKIYFMRTKNLGNHNDITWTWSSIAIWYLCEMHVIIIAGNIPTLWPVLKGFIKKKGGNSGSSGSYLNASGNTERSEAVRLSDMNGTKKAGPATRVLRDIDDMLTVRALDDNGEA